MSLEDFLQPLCITDETLCQLAVDFDKTYRHLAANSSNQFLATPINVLPTGKEKGRFLAIDVGGSNLRVGIVDLLGASRDQKTNISRSFEKSWSIEEHLKYDHAEDLFAWIGDCIVDVIRVCQRSDGEALGHVVPVGITFSFPMLQRSISEATLMPMGKGFAITSNLDLARLLLAGYDRHSDPVNPQSANGSNGHGKSAHPRLPAIRIAAITNDTVATLASLAYTAGVRPNTRVAMGLIVGTGTNATIPMRLSDLHESKQAGVVLQTRSSKSHESVVVNTEWTICGAVGPLRHHKLINKWDEQLDRACEAPGFQPFEYMTAGRYLGEVVRLITYDYFVSVEGADPTSLPVSLRSRNNLSTVWLSKVVASTSSHQMLLAILNNCMAPQDGAWKWTTDRARILCEITETVQQRASKLIAAAVVGLMGCAGELVLDNDRDEEGGTENDDVEMEDDVEDLLVACTGGLIFQYPGFFTSCQNYIDDLVGELNIKDGVRRVRLQEAPEGGIIGAGVLAGTFWNLTKH